MVNIVEKIILSAFSYFITERAYLKVSVWNQPCSKASCWHGNNGSQIDGVLTHDWPITSQKHKPLYQLQPLVCSFLESQSQTLDFSNAIVLFSMDNEPLYITLTAAPNIKSGFKMSRSFTRKSFPIPVEV